MTLLEEACHLLRVASIDLVAQRCDVDARGAHGVAAMLQQHLDRIDAFLARAAEAGDQGADVEGLDTREAADTPVTYWDVAKAAKAAALRAEARTVEAIAAWLERDADVWRRIGSTKGNVEEDMLRSIVDDLRSGAWRPK